MSFGASSTPAQTGRVAELTTAAGRDTFVLHHFEAEEALSSLFTYRIDALSEDQNFNFDRLLGKNACVRFKSYEGVERYFNGVLVDAQWTGVQQALNAYRLTLRPWFWLLGRRANCRIFKDKTVIDIVEDVFKDAGFQDYEVKASRGDFDKIEYCVQYRESDLSFVSRLMEEWGIYTFHEHSESKHQLILADSRSCHRPVRAGGGTIPFIPVADLDRREREHVSTWRADRTFRTGRFATNDFDYMKPTANLKADAQAAERYEKASLEAYDYPGRHTERDLGKKRAKVRLEAEQAADHRRSAAGDAASLYPGGLVTIRQHPADDGQYLVVSARHVIASETYRSGPGAEPGELYAGTYTLQPVDRPFRAPLETPRPRVYGPQTAIVTTRKGKESEEIDVDEEGRVFVQFHWNRDKDRISRPVRVAQMWSGKSWGFQVIPRVGQEVVVQFLEGDPDQPLIVGTVYNKDYPYPYKLPDEKTVSGMKSDSTKGHGGFNQLTFDDKKSSEKINLRAEKDLESLVRNTETREIGVAFGTPSGEPSRATTLKNGDDSLKVDRGNWDVDIAQEIHIKAGTKIVIEVGATKITMDPATMTIESGKISVQGTALIDEKAPLIKLNCA
ncbi:type VI secretion system tip protein TssI/VgrG [Methylobacterium sp. NEAU 140]|uniref:type VI secretion system Vgr family protein n=1 Tax=Methylobacterium sp. NEAU 140 TaxID=3064945 RepID=UPI00273638C2|nr:type VI secretion system tip protein TssI/VgrG [Methylobacterium sp. NEAU 140]MDP4024929.1 type VI secretion system tip protein TssI/VgrG [Methylobacterium sp. NEAU 140]